MAGTINLSYHAKFDARLCIPLMRPIHKLFANPLLAETHEQHRQELRKHFPELSSCTHNEFLSLHRYLTELPHRFFDKLCYKSFLAWLTRQGKSRPIEFKDYIKDFEPELNRAFLFLEEINAFKWHDYIATKDDYELIRFIDQQVHPTYLRLIEGVFAPLLRPVAYFSRLDRGKGTDGLDVWSIVQELSKTKLADLTRAYYNIIRNGIAHGGITFLQKEIRYRDKQDNEEKYGDAEIIRICDDLLDICNGIALAYKVLFLTRQEGDYCIPQQLLLEELQEETGTPWWKIDGCVSSEISGQKQLILYAYAQTRDYSKVQYSTYQSGVLAEFFSPGYDRYLFSIRSDQAWPGWAAFNGNKLAQLRQRNDRTLSDYRGILENDLVFFVPTFRPFKVLTKLETLLHSFRLKWPLVRADVRKQQGKPTITARSATIHRNAWGCVLNAAVVVEAADGEVDQSIIRNSCGPIVRAALRAARINSKTTNFVRYLPLGYARVSVFRTDYRRRRLEGFGLEGDLLGTIQVQRIKRIKSPDILGATIEEMGRYRIAWNHSWIESISGK